MSMDAGVFGGVAVVFSSYCCVYNSLYGLWLAQRKASIQKSLEKESQKLGRRIQKAAAKQRRKLEKQKRRERRQNLPTVVTCGGASERAVMLAAECLGLRHVRLSPDHPVCADIMAIKRRKQGQSLDIIGNVTVGVPRSKGGSGAEQRHQVVRNEGRGQVSGLLVWQTTGTTITGAGHSTQAQAQRQVRTPVGDETQRPIKPEHDGGTSAPVTARQRTTSFSRPPYVSSDGLIIQAVLYNLLEHFLELPSAPVPAPPALLETSAQEVRMLEQHRIDSGSEHMEGKGTPRSPQVQAFSGGDIPRRRSISDLHVSRVDQEHPGRSTYVGRLGQVSSQQLSSYHVNLEDVDEQDKLFYMHLVKSLNVHPLAILNGGLSAYGRR